MNIANKLQSAGIVGAGAKTAALAHILLLKNYQVRVYDVFKDGLDMVLARLEWSFRDSPQVLKNIEIVQDLEKLSDADIILQVDGSGEDKFKLFKTLSSLVSATCIIALNSRNETITEFISAMTEPRRFLGFNFAEPVIQNHLVEVVETKFTDKIVLSTALEFIEKMDKISITAKDSAGIIIERIRRAFIISAMENLEKGRGSPFEIDFALKKSGEFGESPFEMIDDMGLDENLRLADFIYKGLGSPERLKPANIEERLVQYGHLGKKTGLGFYIYDNARVAGQNPIIRNLISYLGIAKFDGREIFKSILRSVASEAEMIVNEMKITEVSVDSAVKIALGWKTGPCKLVQKYERMIQENNTNQWGD